MRFVFLFFILLTCLSAQSQDADSLTIEVDSTSIDSDENTYSESDQPEVKLIPPKDLPATHHYQREKLTIKKFDKKKWKDIVAEKDYNEDPEKKEEKSSSSNEPAISLPWGGALLRLIAYTVIIGIVMLLLYYIVTNVSVGRRLKLTVVEHEDVAAPVENIEDLDFPTLIARARNQRNFRIAIRLYYLGLLKSFHSKGFIVWKKDKTNREYLSELFSKNQFFEEMHDLTVSYELVWYGERVMPDESLEKLVSRFENFYNTVTIPAS